ncbi:hypothetical protein BGZ52_003819 [Haplosporangium bisporale]|uniref:Uncharacterized protein n=1 Tax=Podila verticillata NRRL 6337 TaxID=1069443 RepID=A0A086TKA5_9FUNG|nr:hypothetical protein BGZ52_003819 [Haplosporangium bisporale]KAF9216959.1 hypothetical protein BGZ59_007229 [Podila verticillata]KFH62382.1 hypothetical protein MVEG_11591 [Podila verticillata NRRL 6337]
MSNHPENLDIYDSTGPPAGILATSAADPEEPSTMISVMQDISTFGIAGRIWDSSYVLDVFLRRPTEAYTFSPPCPIPREYFLDTKSRAITTTSLSEASSTESTALPPLRIVEIGAGTGYVGIALAKRLTRDSTLILTDLEEVVPLLERNVQDNLYKPSSSSTTTTSQEKDTPSLASRCAVVKVEALAWGNSAHSEALLSQGPVDFVVASDLVYFPELYPPLLSTLREITTLETKVLFGYKERSLWKETPFWEEFGRFFEIEVVRITKHAKKKEGERKEGEEEEEEEEDDTNVFGCEEDMYVFVATKREDKDILVGVDDTLVTLMMMQISI